jgi:membrane associated rhomboid family serine protease
MIPIRDSERSGRLPVVNVALILGCIAVFVWQQVDPGLTEAYAFRPAELFGRALFQEPLHVVETLFGSMFLHGGYLHIGMNMLFLWVFGDNVEDRMGHLRYLFFYLACGLLAGLVHALFNMTSDIPTVGASGAISGVLGAYLLLFPRARLTVFVPFLWFFGLMELQALPFIILWFILQFLSGMGALAGQASGIAFWAHIGGFLAGIALCRVVVPKPRPPTGPRIIRWDES